MKVMNYLAMTMLGLMSSASFAAASSGMIALSDNELSTETGQALFNMSYIAPSATGNPQTDIGFYKLGMEAQLDLNANIKKLQLGCGGFKGVGCDIDIDNVSFTGIVPTREKTGGTDAGVASDFTLINPFYEIAVKNPGSASTREVVGFRIGADSVWGMLSLGGPPTNGSNANDPANHTGINSLSGHLPTYLSNGVIPVHLCLGANANNTACNSGGQGTRLTGYLNVDSPKQGDNRFDITVNRGTSVYLPDNKVTLSDGGSLALSSNITESLKFIHNIVSGVDSNNNGKYDPGESAKNFGLSLQGQDVQWLTGGNYKADGTGGKWLNAEKGWWLELPEGRIGDFTTRDVYVGLNAIGGLDLVDINLNQYPVDNCYGNLTFC